MSPDFDRRTMQIAYAQLAILRSERHLWGEDGWIEEIVVLIDLIRFGYDSTGGTLAAMTLLGVIDLISIELSHDTILTEIRTRINEIHTRLDQVDRSQTDL